MLPVELKNHELVAVILYFDHWVCIRKEPHYKWLNLTLPEDMTSVLNVMREFIFAHKDLRLYAELILMCSNREEKLIKPGLTCRNGAKESEIADIDRELRTVFDNVADLYDTARPGYPEQLIEDVLTLSEIPPDGTILEVGCGTGQATKLFANRGYTMLCLELGANLAALAAKKVCQFPNVKIKNTSFEAWETQKKAFDLVISAQAFGWIPPEIGFVKAAESLKDSGSLALFRNEIPDTDTDVSSALDEVLESVAPHLAEQRKEKSWDTWTKRMENCIKASGLFKEVVRRQYPWSEQYSAKEYTALIKTYSVFHTLDKEKQRNLLSGIYEVVEQFGGVKIQYIAALSIAKVKR